MAGPRLPNLESLRLVNVQLRPAGFPAFAQAFFTLHYMPEDAGNESVAPQEGHLLPVASPEILANLLYVSETISANTRMNFGVVSLPAMPQQSFRARVNVWVSTNEESVKYRLFYDLKADVRNLVPLADISQDTHDNGLSANAIVWQFEGQAYCLPAHLESAPAKSVAGRAETAPAPKRREKQAKPSYTVDDVRHMSSLIRGVRDFDDIKTATSTEIDTLVARNVLRPFRRDRLVHWLPQLEKLIAKQETANENLESRILATRNIVKERARLIQDDFPCYKSLLEEKQAIVASQVASLHDSLEHSVFPHILSSMRRIVSEVIHAFPIEMAENSTHHSISGIEFPSSIAEILDVCYNGEPKLHPVSIPNPLDGMAHVYSSLVDCINAGLSEIVALLNMLSSVTGVSLKYQMTYAGSRSFLVEHLSPQQVVSNNRATPVAMHVSTTVTYPLYYDIEQSGKMLDGLVGTDGKKYPRNVRFERGLALLNRNLSFFISDIADLYSQYNGDTKTGKSIIQSIPLDCLDHFLGNIHYLMLFITAPLQ
ncbi:hypothetical protein METBIDRAFT_31567 [Metschnikowia bicuspidata var. bicuspidata NRRL YB-4993]|uniref:Uncharacterized protein n=1 Tax=Metschnikowia bicuspidata var. bicuspidata NRRL YB-4993 TaxID=869754 RepID=A0A1A0HA65_9ASCO|nr:hypothetical protein METBIDRAFT_31567 [Metschnikowia bicuspidata var. bicuspidata NRRL YB-4993]OBA20906.1 hypothetical protein METBIDRAFT_31567 [Metschnikowia bicuspidata var. bicuspidata NRRL YB-4993]